jgi:hypothetical protein
MNTTAVSPAPAAAFQILKPSHPSHPSQFVFADEASARNYDRELKSQPFPDGSLPITLVTGIHTRSRTNLIRGLIALRHGPAAPVLLVSHSENSTRRYLHAAGERRDPYVWFYSEKHHSHALAIFAACHPFTRIYLMSPLPCKPSMSASIARMARVICLAA